MKFLLKIVLLLACVPASVSAFNFSIPFYGTYNSEKTVKTQKSITIKNDLTDITDFLEIDENDEKLLQKNISAAALKVNGYPIQSGKTATIPLTDSNCTLTITIRANACAPFFQPQGLLKLLARFISVDITFTHEHTNNDEELSALLMLTEKIDQWEENFPHIKVNYRPLLAARIILADAQRKADHEGTTAA